MNKSSTNKKVPAKRAYRPPAITSSEVFERLALACSGNAAHARKSPATICSSVSS